MDRKLSLLAALAASLVATSATADTQMISFSDSIPSQTTSFDDTLTIPLFDSTLGELCEVKLVLLGDVSGTASYENLDTSPANITLSLIATLTLQRPDLSFLVDVVPLANQLDSPSAFDGMIDFGGTSGNSFTGLSGNAMDMVVLTDALDLALFTGVGSLSLPVSAAGMSNASGGGNIISQFSTSAGAGVEVTYTYKTAPVPEPTSIAVVGLGLVGVLAVRRYTLAA